MMRILHVTRQFLPATGGIERVVQQLAQEQLAAGNEVGVLTLNRLFGADGQANKRTPPQRLPAREEFDGLDVRRISYTGSSRYPVALDALGHAADFDVIHLHSTDFFLNYFASTKRLHRKPLVLTSHGLFFHTAFAQRAKQTYFQSVMRWNLRAVDAVICVSRPDYDLLARITPPDKLHLIPNGVPWRELNALPLSGRDSDLLVAVGSLAPRKRYDRMLHAFAALTLQHPTVRLAIIGADHGEGERLREMARELGIVTQTEFVGRVDETTLYGYLGQATLCLASSEYEAFGIAALEAAIAGALPVMQPLPAYRSIFATPTCSPLFVDYDDAQAAASALSALLQWPEQKRVELARELRTTFQRYSWPHIARSTQALYEAVAASGGLTAATTPPQANG